MRIDKIRSEIKLAIITYIDSQSYGNSILAKKNYEKYIKWAKSATEGRGFDDTIQTIVALAIRQQLPYEVVGFIINDSIKNISDKLERNNSVLNDEPIFKEFDLPENQKFVLDVKNPVLINPYIVVGAIWDFIEWYNKNQNDLTKAINNAKSESKKFLEEPSYPTIATFCLLIKNSKHYKAIGMSDLLNDDIIVNRVKFLEAICKHYNLNYNIRMSKADWSEKDRKEKYDKIIKLIFPKIDKETIEAIETYINSNKLHN
ncbi:MAG TPA: hypothetical protein PKD85_16520 [Saprospiraceae bacterium]|mgnify:CR=1 FL=1|nr:hypothetical protein [Saprospiraceae bacterium]